ncbi:ubinuclein-1 [Xenentodon cancila]
MAESRRVQLTTLSSDGSAWLGEPPSGAAGGQMNRAGGPADGPADGSTVRLVLTLFEPDSRSFPEFSYSQLIKNKINQTRGDGYLNSHEQEEIDEVAAVARRLKEKYGSGHKKKDRIQDLIDIGYGYDDEDSFIDNSEAYDEFVPSSITTKFGGFYVNSGVLQFRQASDTETDDLTPEEGTFKSAKKRKLNGEQDKLKMKRCRESAEMKSKGEPKLSAVSETGPAEMVKKKKKTVRTLSVTSMLKKFQREKEKERQKLEKVKRAAAAPIVSGPTTPLLPADAAGGGSVLTDPLLSLIGSTNDTALMQAASTVDFDIDLDSLLDVSEGTLSPKSLLKTATEMELIQVGMDDPTQLNILSGTEAQDQNLITNSQSKRHPEQVQLLSEPSSTSAQQRTPLPEGLPSGLEDSIRKLLVAAKTSEGESKLKFFNPDVNSILLDIELQCQEQSGQLRSKVYRHLSSFMPCSRDTLLKRVKKLLMAHVEEPPCVEEAMQRLKESIGKLMPGQIACFHENCQAYEQSKTSRNTEEENVEEKSVRKGGPKKLFKWNEEIRECLSHVLKEKMEKFKDKCSQEAEEHLKTLLDNEVKPLWPKGWMQSGVLIRESRKLLGLSTLPAHKVKCLKRPSSISGASKSSDCCNGLQGPLALSELHRGTDNVLDPSNCVSHAPHSSLVNFPGTSVCQGVVPQLLQAGDMRHEAVGPTLMSTDAAATPIC